MYRHQYELSKASMILVRDMLKLKLGETFIVLADTESDPQAVDTIAGAAFTVGAKPMVIWVAAPLDSHRAADRFLPSKAITAALIEAGASISLNYRSLSYSETLMSVFRENKKTRHMVCATMNADTMIRMFGRLDALKLKEFLGKIWEMTKNAKHIRQTTPAGGDVEFDNVKTKDGKPDPNYPISCEDGDASSPGMHFPAGQIGWTPDVKSVNGVIVFDAVVGPPCGLLDNPIRLTMKSGRITKIEGGTQAVQLENWLKKFNDPQMFSIAHATYGYNPGAELNEDMLEGERIWGCTEWGIGAIGEHLVKPNGVKGAEHLDGTCLNTSVWLDGKKIQDKGKQIIPELKKLEEELLAPFVH